MRAISPDIDISEVATLRARLSHRLAKLVDVAPTTIAPREPLVSFTFDDAPICACTTGAAILDAYGARGTYYIAGGLIGTRTAYWRLAGEPELAALHASGHEIGCHTFSHAFLPELGPRAILDETARNLARLRDVVPDVRLDSFAYPFGFASLAAKRALARVYGASRGIAPGMNRGRVDRHFLRANPLIEGRLDADAIARLMDEAAARNGWLIFYGHDVAERPSPYGCTPALLDAALRAAAARDIACVGVAEGLRHAVGGLPGNDDFTIASLARRQVAGAGAADPLP